jgi:hypothetical protein
MPLDLEFLLELPVDPELLSESPVDPDTVLCDEPESDDLGWEGDEWEPVWNPLELELDESDDGLALATAAPLSSAAPTPNVVAPAVSQVDTVIVRCCVRCCARAMCAPL